MTKTRPWETLDRLPPYVALRRRSYEPFAGPETAGPVAAGPVAAGPVVDVGCGAGPAIGEMTARGIPVVGVDPDASLPGEVRRGTAENLPFRDGELAGYRAERVFHLLPDPQAALREARRVLRPGAPIVLVTQDWHLTALHDTGPVATRLLREAAARVRRPDAGRTSGAELFDAGFTDITVEVVTVVLARDDFRVAARALRYEGDPARGYLAMPMFLVTGRTPG